MPLSLIYENTSGKTVCVSSETGRKNEDYKP